MKGSVLFAALAVTASGQTCQEFTLASAQPDYKVCWTVAGQGDARTVTLDLEVKSEGWVGFGLSERTGAQMIGSDILIIEGDELHDRYAVAEQTPVEDSCGNDWTKHSIERSGGWMKARVSRAWTVADKVHDRDFNEGVVQVILATGDSGLKYHKTSRRVAAIEFVPRERAAVEVAQVLTERISFDTAMDGATNTTEYVYAFWDLANVLPDIETVERDIVVVEVVDDTAGQTARLHHMTVKTCAKKPISDEWAEKLSQAARPDWVHQVDMTTCSDFMAAAPGAWKMHTPDGTGLRIKKLANGEWNMRYLVMEYHIDNPEQLSFKTHPELKLSLAKAVQPVEASMIAMGDGAVIYAYLGDILPPGESTWQFDCRGECTQTWDSVKVHSILLHMHQDGHSMAVAQFRDGVKVRTVLEAEYFSFDNQPFVTLDEPVEVLPGDTLSVTCKYDNKRSVNSRFGKASSEEMCIAFAMVTGTGVPFCGPTLGQAPELTTTCGGAGKDAQLNVSTQQLGWEPQEVLTREWGAQASCPTTPVTPAPSISPPPGEGEKPGAKACKASTLGGVYACEVTLGTMGALHFGDVAADGRPIAVTLPGDGWGGVAWPDTVGVMAPAQALLATDASTVGRYSLRIYGADPAADVLTDTVKNAEVAAVGGKRVMMFNYVTPGAVIESPRRTSSILAAEDVLELNYAYGSSLSGGHSHMGGIRINFASGATEEVASVVPKDRKVHAALMFTLWGVLVPLAVLIKRFGPLLSCFEGTLLPYYIHGAIMFCVVISTTAAAGVAYRDFNDAGGHSTCAALLLTCIWLLLILALVKANAPVEMKASIGSAHAVLGSLTQLLAVVQVFLGIAKYDNLYGSASPLGQDLHWAMIAMVLAFIQAMFVGMRARQAAAGANAEPAASVANFGKGTAEEYEMTGAGPGATPPAN